ncbi:MAG TPA: hypothetical protein VGQ62_11775, partial [Chloroflexota bacterium]|nr:hypothetical protein [Chloroflexota bacterium]
MPLFGGVLALLIGVACWAPMAPTILGSNAAADQSTRVLPAAAPPLAAGASAALIPPVVAPVPGVVQNTVATPTVKPTAVPTAVVPATLSPTGQALIAAVQSDRTAQWVKNHTETALRSGPDDGSVVFTQLPQWSTLKQIESRPNWLLVQYGGDGATRQAGPGWVKASEVGAVDAPVVWLSSAARGTVWSAADATAKRVVDMPATVMMEVIGPNATAGTRVHVQLPGDGR